MIQRREPLTSAPNSSARTISAMLTAKTISAARRTWRGDRNDVDDHQQRRGREQQSLPVDEMKGRQIQPLGDGGAGGERHHQADHHQRAERAEQPSVDRAKPIGDGAAFSARNHEPLLEIEAWARGRRLRGDQLRDERAKPVAALLEIGELIVGGAGRRQQHDGLGGGARLGVARRGGDGDIQRSAALEGERCPQACARIRRSPRRSDRPWRSSERARAEVRCRPPSPCRRRSRKCRRTTAAPFRRRRRWSPSNR